MSAIVRLSEEDPREFEITRTYRAPRALVFRVWTDPNYVARWWGVDGATNPVCELDAQVGGGWRIVMQTASGKRYPNRGIFLEVEPERRLVYSDIPDPDAPQWEGRPPETSVHTVTFEDVGEDTQVTLRVRLGSATDRDRLVKLGSPTGLAQGLERLARLLAALDDTQPC